MPDIHLRPATPTDALTLTALAIQVWLDTYAPEGVRASVAREVLTTYKEQAFAAAIASDQTRLVVAERNARLVGFAQITLGERHELAPDSGPQADCCAFTCKNRSPARSWAPACWSKLRRWLPAPAHGCCG